MNIFESVKMSISSIKANKMRSFLTMLGIIIGISSVIMVISLGQGGKNSITGEFEKVGASNITIAVDTSTAQSTDYFTYKDVEQILQKSEKVKYASPSNSARGTAASETKVKIASISGGSPDKAYINNAEILYGRYYNENEYQSGVPVTVIDETSAFTLFGYTDAVDQTITINLDGVSKKVTVVGISKASAMSRPGPPTEEKSVTLEVPATFISNLLADKAKINSVTIMATSQNEAEGAGNKAISIMELRHGNMGQDIYKLQSMSGILDQINSVLSIFTAFIAAIAAISLVVGGIGIMNIMLVSVTERTREIGIRKSIGATTGNILLQFLVESVIISLIGGAVGLAFGILGSNLIGQLANITPVVSVPVALGTLLFSSVIGIFFGIYPARKAAALDPIEALRYE